MRRWSPVPPAAARQADCCTIPNDARGEGLGRPPRDFTDPAWHRRTTPRRAYQTIREGVRGTPMAAWKVLDEQDTWDLVAHVLAVAPP